MSIKIIGGGVIGLTTGTILNSLGYETEILTEDIPIESMNYKDKQGISTEYAIASILPFAVDNKEETEKYFDNSMDIFDIFIEKTDLVENHRHFIGADNNFEEPSFNNVLQNYVQFEDYEGDFPSERLINDGAVFDSQFVHMPEYIPQLIGLYEETGGIIRKTSISRSDIEDDITFNCTGYGSKDLFNDNNLEPVRGYLGYIETNEKLKDSEYGGLFSYSYDIDGKPLYAHSQKDRIVIGTTKIGESFSEEPKEFHATDQGENIPTYIYEENRQIIKENIGLDIEDFTLHGTSGYRPYRKGGVRIEKEDNIIHNYGHGGCGVTLSWGTAIKAIELITNKSEKTIKETTKDVISEEIPIF